MRACTWAQSSFPVGIQHPSHLSGQRQVAVVENGDALAPRISGCLSLLSALPLPHADRDWACCRTASLSMLSGKRK